MFDLALATALAVFIALPYLNSGFGQFVVSMLIVLLLRRHFPPLTLISCTLAAVAQAALFTEVLPVVVAVPVVVYSVAGWSAGTWGQVALAIGMVGSIIGPVRWGTYNNSGLATSALMGGFCVSILLAAYVLGRRRKESTIARAQREQSADERNRLLSWLLRCSAPLPTRAGRRWKRCVESSGCCASNDGLHSGDGRTNCRAATGRATGRWVGLVLFAYQSGLIDR